jgi:hypothetical protein
MSPRSLKITKRSGGTGVLTCAWAGGGACPHLRNLSLVPKLRLGNQPFMFQGNAQNHEN